MTREEFEDALRELGGTDFLERVARRSGAGSESQDIAQEVRTKLAGLTPEKYAGVRNIKPYAAEMVRNQWLEVVVERRAEMPLDELNEDEKKQLLQRVDERIGLRDPYEIYEQEQVSEHMHRLIENIMNPIDRAIARATYLNGASTRAAAEQCGVTPHVARTARERAWKRIVEFFNSEKNDSGGGN